MSRENVEVVRRACEAYVRGDRERAVADFDPKVVYKRAEEAAVHGPEGVKAAWDSWEADWTDLETVAENFVDAGDRVLVSVLFRGRGRASGIEIEGRFFQVLTLRDGKIVHWEEFSEHSEAIEAVGLAE